MFWASPACWLLVLEGFSEEHVLHVTRQLSAEVIAVLGLGACLMGMMDDRNVGANILFANQFNTSLPLTD